MPNRDHLRGMLVGVASALVMIGLVACGQPEAPPAEAEPEPVRYSSQLTTYLIPIPPRMDG